MKNTIVLLTFTLLLLAGCASYDGTEGIAPSQTEDTAAYTESEDACVSGGFDASVVEAREQYAKMYNTTHVFTDMYIPEKAWLIGEENIVELTSIAGFNDVSALTRDSIERVEQTSFSGFATVKIIDKTGNALSLTVHPQELFEILDLIE